MPELVKLSNYGTSELDNPDAYPEKSPMRGAPATPEVQAIPEQFPFQEQLMEQKPQTPPPTPRIKKQMIRGKDRRERIKWIRKIEALFNSKHLSKYLMDYELDSEELYEMSLDQVKLTFDELLFTVNTSRSQDDVKNKIEYGLRLYETVSQGFGLRTSGVAKKILEDEATQEDLEEFSIRVMSQEYTPVESRLFQRLAVESFKSHNVASAEIEDKTQKLDALFNKLEVDSQQQQENKPQSTELPNGNDN